MILNSRLLSTAAALTLVAAVSPRLTLAFAQGTAFTYQGRLNDGGGLANGSYDLRFAIFDTNQPAGMFIAGPITNSATAVSSGLFTVSLDFGAGIFTGANRWLEIAARTNGNGAFTTLAPRQPLTPTSYAIFAATASNVLGMVPSSQITGTISSTQLPANVVTNTETGLTLGGNFSGNGGELMSLNASQLQTGMVPTNVLAGFQAPFYAFIGGGQNNTADNTYAVVAGGYNNTAGYQGTVPGGSFNIASGFYSFAAGQQAQALHQGAFVWADSQPGPFASTASDTFNVRAYGGVNFSTRSAPVTINGSNVLTTANLGNFWQTTGNAGTSPAAGDFLGTTDNHPLELWVNSNRALRLEFAGTTNIYVTNISANIIGGYAGNVVTNGYMGAFIAGGSIVYPNLIGADFGAIPGGQGNVVTGTGSIAMGEQCTVAGVDSIAAGLFASVGFWGQGSTALGEGCAANEESATALGAWNTADGWISTVLGGFSYASGDYAMAMGRADYAYGDYSLALGTTNTVNGNFSAALGNLAIANHDHVFVWSDGAANTTFSSTTTNQFAVRATGGVVLNAGNNNVEIASGGLKVTGAGIGTGTTAFIQRATGANIDPVGLHRTTINNPYCNGNSNALLIVTANYNPGNAGNIIQNHPYGVYYNQTLAKWQIFNEDLVALTTNTAFNVMIVVP